MHEDDGALARRIMAAGAGHDADAEAELCRRFAPRIRLYGLRHLRSDAAAADLVQDVLLMTLQKLRAGAVREPDSSLPSFSVPAGSSVIDGRRSGGRRERILDTFARPGFASNLEDDTTPGSIPLACSMPRAPARERERSVLVMTFYDDRPADAVGSDAGTVRRQCAGHPPSRNRAAAPLCR